MKTRKKPQTLAQKVAMAREVKLGDPVRLRSNPNVTGTISKLPSNSAKRKRPRIAVVDDYGTEIWLFADEVEPINAPE